MEKEIVLREVSLKNVLTPDGERDIVAKVVPFSRRNEDHVQFAFDFADMLGGSPSRFKNQSEAARGYVETFMSRTVGEESDPSSDYSCVYSDLRAARVLFFQSETRKEFDDFFVNA